jgi:YbaB/EbfC DNA-binding family
MSGYGTEVEELMGRYRQKLADLTGLQRRVEGNSATVASAYQSVRVTVTGQGEITSLVFPTGAYRVMPPAEPAEEILAAVSNAKAIAREPLKELLEPTIPDGPGLLELVRQQVDASRQASSPKDWSTS